MEIKNFKKNTKKDNSKIFDALKILNTTKIKILFVLNSSGQLVGTITDGDLRRAFLKGIHTKDFLPKAMKKNPKFIFEHQIKNTKLIKKFLFKNKIEQLPVITKKKKLKKILQISEYNNLKASYKNPFIIMAGGLGKRLMPITKKIPKPMIKIANKPIIQHIIENASYNGFSNFLISVNYLKNKIKNYFEDGNKFGVKINYLEENSPLGTAGSLSLLNTKNKLPIVVVNGDTITEVNFKNLVDYHIQHKSQFTIVTNLERKKSQVGVVETKLNKVINIIEKPLILTKINTGIYVINKNIIKMIKKNNYLNMTDLIKKVLKKKLKVISFPIYESWEDLGTKENLVYVKKKINTKSLNL